MSVTCRRFMVALMLCAAAVSCNRADGPHSASDVQMDKMDQSKASFGSYFTHMTDNAMLSDMSLADMHFIPHTNELSGLGEVRIDRMAKLLSVYGGTVRYATELGDEAMIEQRMEHVREYLTLVGCSMDRVTVAVMGPGGIGMPGAEAVRNYRSGTAGRGGGATGQTGFIPVTTGGSQGR